MIKLTNILKELTNSTSAEIPGSNKFFIDKDKKSYKKRVKKAADIIGYQLTDNTTDDLDLPISGSVTIYDFFLPSEDGAVETIANKL